MSNVAVVPSPRVPVSSWMADIASGLRLAKVHGLEEVRVLADNVPATASWVSNPTRQNSGVIFQAVATDWSAADNVRARNEALLTGVETVVVLGHVATSSARHTLSRVFGNPKGPHVVQVIDGEAKVVGSTTIQTAPGMEISAPKQAGPREDAVWSEFTSAPKAKAKK